VWVTSNWKLNRNAANNFCPALGSPPGLGSLHENVAPLPTTASAVEPVSVISPRVKPGSAALVLSFTLAVAYLLPGASPSRPSDGQKPNDPDELLARAKANGYRRGEHREQDAVPDRHAYIDKTI